MKERNELKKFELGTVLSITTGRLLTTRQGPNDNGIGRMYKLLGHMTKDSPLTHQLIRFAEECKPWLIRWFPELATANDRLNTLDRLIKRYKSSRETAQKKWFEELKKVDQRIQDYYEIGQIPLDDHNYKNPYDELITELGTDENIIICEIDNSQ